MASSQLEQKTLFAGAYQYDDLMSSLNTIGDFVRFALSRFNQAELFYGHGTDNALDEALLLVLQSLHLPWDLDKALYSGSLTQVEKTLLLERLDKRVIARVPTAYLLGEAWFMGLPFHVDERVLVPRSPIAELIEKYFYPWAPQEPVERVLDLCTGSGCIGIACAVQFEDAQVDLVDISTDALDVARSNIARHHLGDRVRAIQSDLFDQISDRYDIIVSNPPYVDQQDLSTMPEEFGHEPVLGLEAGNDGLDLVRFILKHAAAHLTNSGILVVEVGNSWIALEETYPEIPFTWIEFEHGGGGVFVLTRDDLVQATEAIEQALPS
ncbi:ribosomal protein L3-specific protein-(glutamine-N5) methyltransferase [Oleiphilus messinensis]|uniref:Ribosomal protein uL3 glutamine methyltransferase n=1 Tax=Oleiphilus messinensis TaxID=141451 RepID=A0A1Y0I9X7_9GAMM|nr:50S ribosomal protein L3 N(5)-glutamine methyltransferase [Oleiphilus messinensis]ARU57327.1 ribosomal protein L3-specific protein-(glutamine-N5) methyltransferase [Oleiphilus messinensis]